MIERAMIFALGFLAACLLTLLALPIVSRRARRDERLRVERRLPLSLVEIAAERDQLRAAHAVALRRAEQRAEALEPRIAAAMAEAGRLSAALAVAGAERREVESVVTALRSNLAEATARGEAAEVVVAAQGRQLGKLASAEGAARDTIARLAASVADAEERARAAEATAGAQTIALNDLTALADHNARPLDLATATMVEEPPAALAGLVPRRSSPEPVADDHVALRAALTRLRMEQSIMNQTVAAATGERDWLRLRVDELLLRIENLQAGTDGAAIVAQGGELAAAEAPGLGAGRESPRDPAALRLAIAALAADLVRYAIETETP